MTESETAGADSAGEWRVEVIGSTQRWIVNKPLIAIYWNGDKVGAVEHGGRFNFNIVADGDVRFKYSVRSAELSVKAGGDTTIQLSWDRLWGRLVAKAI